MDSSPSLSHDGMRAATTLKSAGQFLSYMLTRAPWVLSAERIAALMNEQMSEIISLPFHPKFSSPSRSPLLEPPLVHLETLLVQIRERDAQKILTTPQIYRIVRFVQEAISADGLYRRNNNMLQRPNIADLDLWIKNELPKKIETQAILTSEKAKELADIIEGNISLCEKSQRAVFYEAKKMLDAFALSGSAPVDNKSFVEMSIRSALLKMEKDFLIRVEETTE